MKHLALLILVVSSLTGQEKTNSSVGTYESSFLVLNVGAGLGFYNFYGFVGVTFPTNNIDFGVRYLTSRELVAEIAFAGNPGFKRPIQFISETDMLIGKTFYYRGLSASVFSGLGVVSGTFRGKQIPVSVLSTGFDEYEHLDKTVLGVPLEARIAVRPSKYVDVGVSGFVNINRNKNYSSFTLSVQLAAPF